MHELAIAEGLMRTALAALKDAPAKAKATELEVEVGELSTVVPELLQSSFEIAAQGTRLAGAKLRIKKIALGFECRGCGRRFGTGHTACPGCGAPTSRSSPAARCGCCRSKSRTDRREISHRCTPMNTDSTQDLGQGGMIIACLHHLC